MELSEYDQINNPELAKTDPTPGVPKKAPKVVSKDTPKNLSEYDMDPAKMNPNLGTSIVRTGSPGTHSTDGEYVVGTDLGEQRAQRQSGFEQWMNGGLKGTGLAATTAASTFTALPYGILKGIAGAVDPSQTSAQAFSNVYDNEVSQVYDKFNKNMETWFPNYYTEKETKASAFDSDNWATMNFFADKVVKNTGFTAGAMFSGSVAAKGLANLGRLTMGGRFAQEAAAVNALISSGMPIPQAMSKVAKTIRALDVASTLGASAIAAAGEGGMEAKQAKDELKEHLASEYRLKYGKDAEGEDLDKIDRTASAAGNTVFATNMAVLTASDFFQFGKLFSKGFKQEVARVGKITGEIGEEVAVKQTVKRQFLNSLGNVSKNGAMEAFEEGTQTGTQAGSKEYYTRTYDSNGRDSTHNMVAGMLGGMQETFGTKEGLESMLLGAITGVGSHVVQGAISKFLNRGNPTSYDLAVNAAKKLNDIHKSKAISSIVDGLVRDHSINEEQEAELRKPKPSILKFKNLNHDKLKSIVQAHIESDRFDMLEEKFQNEFDKEDLSERGTVSKKNSKQYVGTLMSEAKRLRDSWDDIDTRFPKAGKDAKVALWSAMTDIKDRDNRFKELELEIFNATGVHYTNMAEKGELDQFIAKVEAKIEEDPSAVDPDKVQDLLALVKERAALVTVYKKLMTPEEQALVEANAKANKDALNKEVPLPVREEPKKAVEVAPEELSEYDQGDSPTEVENVAPTASSDETKALASSAVEPVGFVGQPLTDAQKQPARTSVLPTAMQKTEEDSEAEIKEGFKGALRVLKGQLNAPDADRAAIKEMYQEFYEEEEDPIKKEILRRLVEAMNKGDKAKAEIKDAPVEQVEDADKTDEEVEKIVETPGLAPLAQRKKALVRVVKDLRDKGMSKEDIIELIDDMMKEKDADVEALTAVKSMLEKGIQDELDKAEAAKRPTPEVPEVVGTEPIDPTEQPDIIEDDEVQRGYHEGEYMSHTAMRSTSNHQEAIDKDIKSILRYQNWFNSPEANTLGVKFLVITDTHPLYEKLQNKKQKGYKGGIMLLVVNEEGKAIISDGGGMVTDYVDVDSLPIEDIDSEFGPLVTTPVKEAELKDSGHYAVSLRNFAKSIGLINHDEHIDPKDAEDINTPLGAAWARHKQELAEAREGMLNGTIKTLRYTGGSMGIYNEANADKFNPVGPTLNIDINSSEVNFVIAKLADPTFPGYARLTSFHGLSSEQWVKVGKPYLIYKGRLYPLKARTLNTEEVTTVSQLLGLVGRHLANGKTNDAQKVLTLVKRYTFIYPSKAAAMKTNAAKAIWIEGDMLYFGTESIKLSDAHSNLALGTFLISKYRQVEAKALAENPDVSVINSVNEKGVGFKKAKITYRESIMENESPAVALAMSPHPLKTSDAPNFFNGYTQYSPIKELPTEKVVEAEKEAVPTPKTATKIAGRKRKIDLSDDAEEDTIIKKRKRVATLAVGDYVKENIAEMQEWFNKKFPGEQFTITKGLIDGDAFGEYSSAATKLYEGAEQGTGYHEAFHKVTQEYLTTKQRASLYDEARKVKGNERKSDDQLEEYLAEDFRLYMLSGQKTIKGRPVTNSIFRKLVDFLKKMFGKTTVKEIYEKLGNDKPMGAKKFSKQFVKLKRAIPGLSHTQTKHIVDSVNAHFFATLFKSELTPDEIVGEKGKDYVAQAYNAVYAQLKRDYKRISEDEELSDEQFNAISEHYEFMLSVDPETNKPTGLNKAVINAHKEYLSGLGIHLHPMVGTEVTEGDEQEDEPIDSRNQAEWTQANEQNPMDSTPNAIKLLIMSLPEIDQDGDMVDNPIGGPQLADFKQTYNLLLKHLCGLSQFSEMYDKMKVLSREFPVFNELMKRLAEPSGDTSLEQTLLQNQFRQTFSKFESKGTITLINPETGDYYQLDANANRLMDRIKEKWTVNLRAKADDKNGYVVKNEAGILTVDPTRTIGGKSILELPNKLFLSSLGIEFTDYTDKDFNAKVNPETVNAVKIAVKELHENGKPINDLFARDADIVGRMNELLALEAEVSKEVVELSYMSAEGKRIYAVTLNNYYSLIINAVQNARSYSELIERYPHLDNPYTQNSIWLKAIFPNKGDKHPGAKLEMNTVSGMKNQDDNTSGVAATKLEPADKAAQEINDLLLHGTTSLTRAGDKATEYAFKVTSFETTQGENMLPVPIKSIEDHGFNNDDVKSIFLGYFNDELARIRDFTINGKGKNIAIYNKQAGDWSIFTDILRPATKEALEPYKSNEEVVPNEIVQLIKNDLIAFLNAVTLGTKNTPGLKQKLKAMKIGIETKSGYTGISSKLAHPSKKNLDVILKAFTVNHLINTIEQHKLMIGDPAFYKDKFKRISGGTGTKKTSASGKAVDNWFNNFYEYVGRQDGKKSNSIIRSVVFDDHKAVTSLRDEYFMAIKDVVGEEKATSLMKSSYDSMDEGDAQGWITLDEYREFFIRTGEWHMEHEAQYKYEVATEAKEKRQELEPWMEEAIEEGNPGYYFMPIKAQHFGAQVMDGIYAPAFHKYSLAPLYHSLVKGRNMENLMLSMRDNHIGYALFGSGSKVGTLLDEKGKLPAFYNEEGNIRGIKRDTPIQKISYEFLGIQLDIAPKVKEKVIFGSQFRKLVMSNLFGIRPVDAKEGFEGLTEEEKIKNSKLYSLMKEYNSVIDKLVQNEMTKLLADLDITKNEDGTFTFANGHVKLVETLKEVLADKDTPENVFDNLSTDENGNLLYPIDSMVNRPKVESMLFTIVNSRVIKQKMPGDGMVQLASSGFEAKGPRKVGSSNYLNFYSNKGPNGTTTAMEVEVPMMAHFEPLLTQYGSIDALNAAIAKGDVDQRMLTMIGYRIPTQGLNSIDYIKIKRFLPDSNGNSIILPTEVVAKSGGDYDIDKLNIFRANMVFDEKTGRAKYVSGKKENKKGLQNRLIEISAEVLAHPANYVNLIMPNTTETLTDLVGDIRDAQGFGRKIEKASATKELLFSHILDQFAYFLGGKAGVGIGAVHNTHHTLSQIAQVKLNINKSMMPFKANTSGNQLDFGKMTDTAGNLISDLISQFINAYVDVAKDPFYKDLNAGTEVAGVWFYLIRAGVDIKTIAYFMTQPIILNYVSARKINKSLIVETNGLAKNTRPLNAATLERLSEEYQVAFEKTNMTGNSESAQKYFEDQAEKANRAMESIYNEMEAEWVGTPTRRFGINFQADDINNKLLKYIKQGATGKVDDEFRNAQRQMLQYFVDFEEHAAELTTLMRATNQDTTQLQNYGSILNREMINQTITDSDIIPAETKGDILSKTIVGSFDQVKNIKGMFKDLMMSTSNPRIKNALDKILKEVDPSGGDFEKVYNTIQNDFIGYITQLYGLTKEGKKLADVIGPLFNGPKSLSKRLVAINRAISVNPNHPLASNPLIKELVAQINEDTESIDNIKLYSRRMTAFESNILTGAFREIMDSNDPSIAQFGRDLGYLAILQSGLHNSPISFTNLVPFEFYGNIVKDAISKATSVDMDDFRNRFYIKNQTDARIVPYISKISAFKLDGKSFVRAGKKGGYDLMFHGNLITDTYLSGLSDSIKPFSFRLQDFGLSSHGMRIAQAKALEDTKMAESSADDVDVSSNQADAALNVDFGDEKGSLGSNEGWKDDMDKFGYNPDGSPQFQKSDSTSILDENYVRTTLEKLKAKFGLEFEIINDRSKKWAGKFENGIATVNLAYAKHDTAFHEFGHPFIAVIKRDNQPLYLNLARQIQEEGTILRRVQALYPELTPRQQIEEAIVQALGELAVNKEMPKGLLQALKTFLKRVAEYLGMPPVRAQYFDANSTLSEIAMILRDDTILDLREAPSFGIQKARQLQKLKEKLVSLGLLDIVCK